MKVKDFIEMIDGPFCEEVIEIVDMELKNENSPYGNNMFMELRIVVSPEYTIDDLYKIFNVKRKKQK